MKFHKHKQLPNCMCNFVENWILLLGVAMFLLLFAYVIVDGMGGFHDGGGIGDGGGVR